MHGLNTIVRMNRSAVTPFATLRLDALVTSREELEAIWHAVTQYVENIECEEELLSPTETASGEAARRVMERIDAAYAALADRAEVR